MGDDDPLGIMIYGYGREEAEILSDAVSRSASSSISVIDASGKEEDTINRILGSGGSGSFLDREVKLLMFLGFDDEMLGKCMDDLRSVPGIRRPIFCCLTEENVGWPLSRLISDLLEEDRYWKGRGPGAVQDKDA